ncbi:hypothetical protein J7E96_30250 [Streptomyces sp. ISL-96]|uniref:hypothetical protein n=1 Tax=Streptomyces sp. ISL-96 TaxID=2819191 RepID=UPI001BE93F43|nr:hypothetical protein [Streptomyces sp. ISL-96]MBT2492717.1 hypothetical protein [Streptomyces sp. ISL-96]
MPNSLAVGPAATAIVIRVATQPARRSMQVGGIIAALSAALAITVVGICARSAVDSAEAWPSVLGGAISLTLPAIGVRAGIRTFRAGLDWRRLFVAADETGLWVSNGTGLKAIRWNTLAATALHWSKAENPTGKDYSIELCPTVAVDPEDPVLAGFVRDDEPFRPGLPRLRYRFNGNYPYREALVKAIRHHAPHLWAGEHEREPGYIGRPVSEPEQQRR